METPKERSYGTVYGDIIFGKGYPHNLPDGWVLRESADNWAYGVDPEGQVYYLTKTGAYPKRILPEDKGDQKTGDVYADTKNAIKFTNKI